VFKRFFDFFIFTSLFIAACAVLMTYQTTLLFHLPFSFALAGFVFSGSVCSYNFHWYLTPSVTEQQSKKLAWNFSNKKLHLILFIAGLVGSAVFSLMLIEHWIWLGVTAIATFLYSAPKIPFYPFTLLRKIAVAKTIYLAFAWMHVTTLLPLMMSVKQLHQPQVLFIINRFFFLYAICILFDYRDVEEDRRAGIRSMITYFSEPGVLGLFRASLVIFAITAMLLLRFFSVEVVIALLIPGIILSLLYRKARTNFSDYFYYFVLDGLMMLSAPLLLLIKFAR
jgi:4-hydroxybenzoate polyprenyltransferase